MGLPAGLIGHVGTWAGTNGFRLMPSDSHHHAPATAEVSSHAGGNLVAVAYTWSHATDGPQDGFLVLGAGDDEGSIVAFWGDSWHQHPQPRAFDGTADGGVVTVSYEYAPGWSWTIVVDATSSESLRIRMDNTVPDGDPYAAMVMDLRPVQRADRSGGT